MKAAEEGRHLTVHTPADVDRYLNQIRKAASRTSNWVRPLNLMEQINQTWMYVVTLEAARLLLTWHPEAGGFHLAPGAGTALQLDIMSETAGVVGAETFAAVDPENNDKLNKDLAKMAKRDETYRYVFFMSPLFPNTKQQHKLERVDGVKVWSVAAPTLPALSQDCVAWRRAQKSTMAPPSADTGNVAPSAKLRINCQSSTFRGALPVLILRSISRPRSRSRCLSYTARRGRIHLSRSAKTLGVSASLK